MQQESENRAGPRYSLWLVPGGAVADYFSGMIRKLSRQFGTPCFAPHVTLLGSIREAEETVLARTERLVSGCPPITLRLGDSSGQAEYFRALFIKVTENPSLSALAEKARRLFQRESDPLYFPHLSLLYGYLPADIKKGVMAELKDVHPVSFLACHLQVHSTAGTPELWRKIGEFPLEQSETPKV